MTKADPISQPLVKTSCDLDLEGVPEAPLSQPLLTLPGGVPFSPAAGLTTTDEDDEPRKAPNICLTMEATRPPPNDDRPRSATRWLIAAGDAASMAPFHDETCLGLRAKVGAFGPKFDLTKEVHLVPTLKSSVITSQQPASRRLRPTTIRPLDTAAMKALVWSGRQSRRHSHFPLDGCSFPDLFGDDCPSSPTVFNTFIQSVWTNY